MSRNLTLNEITVITIADNVDTDSDSENISFTNTDYLLLFNVLLAENFTKVRNWN